jgi:aminopeptidase N
MTMETNSKSAGRVLLPDYVEATKYDLKLTPDLEKFTFDGIITVFLKTDASKLKADEDGKEITLHSKELLYKDAKVTLADGKTLTAEQIIVNIKATTVTFVFAESVVDSSNSDIQLTIDFVGCLNNQMSGFYRSTYTDTNGDTKIVASTQFEALDARRCFPCIDEPAAKATFLVTLVVPRHLECFSNMPESYRMSKDKELVEISFLETPKMSTYLLAFCVGEFDFIQAQNEHGVLIKVYAPRGQSKSCQYALETACKALDAYDDFFGLHYPLPKLDMVAIPEFVSAVNIAVTLPCPAIFR